MTRYLMVLMLVACGGNVGVSTDAGQDDADAATDSAASSDAADDVVARDAADGGPAPCPEAQTVCLTTGGWERKCSDAPWSWSPAPKAVYPCCFGPCPKGTRCFLDGGEEGTCQ